MIGAPVKSKIAFVIGLTVGYVFGTRAGRQRYEQIKSGAAALWNSALVRRGRDQVSEYATDLRGTVQDSVLESGRAFINAIIDRQKSHQSSDTPAAAQPSESPSKPATAAKGTSSAKSTRSTSATKKPKTSNEVKPEPSEKTS